MSTEIELINKCKLQKNNTEIIVSTKLKKARDIHPILKEIVYNLSLIDIIRFIRITPEELQASNEIKKVGRARIPITNIPIFGLFY